jgi:hypothetical protein
MRGFQIPLNHTSREELDEPATACMTSFRRKKLGTNYDAHCAGSVHWSQSHHQSYWAVQGHLEQRSLLPLNRLINWEFSHGLTYLLINHKYDIQPRSMIGAGVSKMCP